MSEGVTLEFKVHIQRGNAGSRVLKHGPAPEPPPVRPPASSAARLLALALHFEELIWRGEVEDFAAVAELGYVTRARVSQIANLLNLAPDIQERVLLDPALRDLTERQLRDVASHPDWVAQREAFACKCAEESRSPVRSSNGQRALESAVDRACGEL